MVEAIGKNPNIIYAHPEHDPGARDLFGKCTSNIKSKGGEKLSALLQHMQNLNANPKTLQGIIFSPNAARCQKNLGHVSHNRHRGTSSGS